MKSAKKFNLMNKFNFDLMKKQILISWNLTSWPFPDYGASPVSTIEISIKYHLLRLLLNSTYWDIGEPKIMKNYPFWLLSMQVNLFLLKDECQKDTNLKSEKSSVKLVISDIIIETDVREGLICVALREPVAIKIIGLLRKSIDQKDHLKVMSLKLNKPQLSSFLYLILWMMTLWFK